jgi:hypothetical protein
MIADKSDKYITTAAELDEDARTSPDRVQEREELTPRSWVDSKGKHRCCHCQKVMSAKVVDSFVWGYPFKHHNKCGR